MAKTGQPPFSYQVHLTWGNMVGDGLEQGRTEITSCYHQGLSEGGGQWFQDGTRPKHNASATNNNAGTFVVLKQMQHVINKQEQ